MSVPVVVIIIRMQSLREQIKSISAIPTLMLHFFTKDTHSPNFLGSIFPNLALLTFPSKTISLTHIPVAGAF